MKHIREYNTYKLEKITTQYYISILILGYSKYKESI